MSGLAHDRYPTLAFKLYKPFLGFHKYHSHSMRIAIVGAGGVGGYFGGRLAATGTDVTFIARGAHLAALRERGLRIESPQGNIHVPRVQATDDPSSIGPVDIVFFTVKLYQTDEAARLLPPLIGPRTLVISFQNGVDAVETLSKAIGRDHVAGGTTYVAAVVTEPGVIRHTAMGKLVFGPLGGEPPPILAELADACQRAGFPGTLSRDITTDIWAKFARLTVLSGMTAVTRCPLGGLREDPELVAMVRAALTESFAVARACGIELSDKVFEDIQGSLASLPPNMRSSMLEDLERGRPLELPWLSGAIVRIGQQVGVDTPVHKFITTVLTPHVNGKST
jgi:2-dehydropantoate 2-reductase